MFKRNKDSLLAIDLAPEGVRALDVSLRRGAPKIAAIAAEALEPGGSDTLPERHLAALEKLLAAHRVRPGPCVAALPTSLVVTRSVTIDPSKSQPRDEQIRQTLQNCISGDPRGLVFDAWPVSEPAADPAMAGASGGVANGQGRGRTHDVLVVASQASVIHRYLDGFSRLRLDCRHLDVAPCALATLIAHLLPAQDALVGTIALSESVGYFAVVEKQRVLFWRPFEIPDASRATPQAKLARIGDEISKCVSHMVGSLHLDAMTELFAFGRGACDEAFGSYLMHRFNLQVRSPSPFDSLPEGARGEALDPASASDYAAALGLALQTQGGPAHG